MQDLGTASGPSNSLSRRRHPAGRLVRRRRRRGGAHRPRPGRSRTSSTPASTAATSRATITGRGRRATSRSTRRIPSGHGGEDLKYRFQWTAPILTSRHTPGTGVSRGQRALPEHRRRAELGRRSAPTSPATTSRSRSGRAARSPATTPASRSTGRSSRIAESPKDKALLWAGSDDGLVHVTRDAGRSWTNVTKNVPGLPEWGTVSHHRGVAVRRRHRVRRGGCAPARRHAALPLEDQRLRPELEAARREPAPGRLPPRGPRGSGAARAALRRHRARRGILHR